MNKPEYLTKLFSSWKNFFLYLFNPLILVFLLITVFAIINTDNPSSEYSYLLSIFISIISGILGGIITYKISEHSGQKEKELSGNMAVRSLTYTLLSVYNVRDRICEYIKRVANQHCNEYVTVFTYEEIIEKLALIEAAIVKSIDDWGDINPKFKTSKNEIDIIFKLNSKIAKLTNDNISLSEKIKANESTAEDKQTLIEELARNQKELTTLQGEHQAVVKKLNQVVNGGLSAPPYGFGSSGTSGFSHPVGPTGPTEGTRPPERTGRTKPSGPTGSHRPQ